MDIYFGYDKNSSFKFLINEEFFTTESLIR